MEDRKRIEKLKKAYEENEGFRKYVDISGEEFSSAILEQVYDMVYAEKGDQNEEI